MPKIKCAIHTNVKPKSLLTFSGTNTSYFVDKNMVRHKVILDGEGKIIGQPIKMNKKQRRKARQQQVTLH